MSKAKSEGIFSRENILGFCVGIGIVLVLYFFYRSSDNGIKKTLEGVRFNPPVLDLGTMMQNESVSRTIELKNNTTNVVTLLALRSTCNCTVIQTGTISSNIMPGQSIIVPVQYDSRTDEGEAVSSVEALLTSNGEQLYARASLRGWINADYSITPRIIDFGTIRPGEKASQVVRLVPKALDSSAIKSSEITAASSSLTVSPVGQQSENALIRELTISILAPSSAKTEMINSSLVIETTSERIPKFTIPITAKIRPIAEISPDSIVLSPRNKNEQSLLRLQSNHLLRTTKVLLKQGDQRKDMTKELLTLDSSSEWAEASSVIVPHNLISQADGLIFELSVQNDTGDIEAHLVSVQIVRL